MQFFGILVVVAATAAWTRIHAFSFICPCASVRSTRRIKIDTTTVLRLDYNSDYNNNGDDKKKNGIEQARQQLESLLVSSSEKSENEAVSIRHVVDEIVQKSSRNPPLDLDTMLPPPPPLTAAERERRTTELQLLERLASSDEIIGELLALWESERGSHGQERLQQATTWVQQKQYILAEQLLWQVLDDYGVAWVEPFHRLALLKVQTARWDEAHALWLVVLHEKPWHMGALDGMMELYRQQGDRDRARKWATKRLPPLIASSSFPPFATTGPANPQRATWVANALQQAQEALCRLDYQTQCDFFGSPEDYYKEQTTKSAKKLEEKRIDTVTFENSSQKAVVEDADGDAWQ